MDTTGYYMPSAVRLQSDIVPGIGVREIVYTGVVAAVLAAIAGMIYIMTGAITTGVFIVIVGIALTLGWFMRDENNQSLASQFGAIWRFWHGQKDFSFEYLNEWGGGT